MQTSSTWKKKISKNMANLNMTLLLFPPINRLEITVFSLLCPRLLPFFLLSPCEWSPACVIVWEGISAALCWCTTATEAVEPRTSQNCKGRWNMIWIVEPCGLFPNLCICSRRSKRISGTDCVAFQCVAVMQELQWSYFQLLWCFTPYIFPTRSINVPVRGR